MLVDLSFVVSRNIFSISNWKKPGDYREGDVIKSIIQTLAKIFRDYGITADKIVFIGD